MNAKLLRELIAGRSIDHRIEERPAGGGGLGHDKDVCVLKKHGEVSRMSTEPKGKISIEPEGWHIDAGPPSWNPKTKTFSFFLHKPGREPVLCILTADALEKAIQSSELSRPALTRIFDAHRQMIELRAAQKLNAGLLDPSGSVLVGADDSHRRGQGA